MRNKFPLLLGAIAAVVIGAYVLTRSGSDANKPKETLVIFGEDSSNLNAYASLAKDFTTKTGIALRFEGATFEQSVQKADADFRNGKGDYDIVLQYNFSLAPYVRNNYVAEISEVVPAATLDKLSLNADLFQNALRETSFYYSNPGDTASPAKQFGLPFAANTMVLVYNKNLFQDAALRSKFKQQTGRELLVPTDWAEYLLVAEFFARQPGLSGVCMQGAADGWLYYELANYLFSMGTGTSRKQRGWEENAPLTIATRDNEKVLRYMKQLRATSAGDYFTVGASQQQELMLRGKTAMAIMWTDYLQPLAAGGKAAADPHFSFAPIPGKISGLAGGAFYLNRKSRNLAAAAQFVLFALEPENQRKLMERGLISPLKSSYTDEVMTKVPYARALRDSLDRGVFMFEAGTDAEIISSVLTTYTQKFMRGEISEAQALSSAQQEIFAKRSQAR